MNRILFVALLGLSAMACGGNECDDAADKLDECGISGEGEGDGDGECEGLAECGAKCINAASCDELKSTDLNNNYYKCMAECGS